MKIGVCVPYRNREAHLNVFVPTVSKYLESQGIDYCIYFGHQVDDKLFNAVLISPFEVKIIASIPFLVYSSVLP